jgi:hypothetical protein
VSEKNRNDEKKKKKKKKIDENAELLDRNQRKGAELPSDSAGGSSSPASFSSILRSDSSSCWSVSDQKKKEKKVEVFVNEPSQNINIHWI